MSSNSWQNVSGNQGYPSHSPDSKNPRPTFLLVLCILSFIGGGLSILGGIVNLAMSPFYEFSKNQMERNLQNMPDHMPGIFEDFMEFSAQTLDNIIPMAVSQLLLSIISVIGVYYMFQLKKLGFHLYTAAQVFMLIVPLIFLGMNWMTIFSVVFGSLFSIAFIIMYSMNLKHMHD